MPMADISVCKSDWLKIDYHIEYIKGENSNGYNRYERNRK